MSLLGVDLSWAHAQPCEGAAFDWWYVDARTPAGDGLVLIVARRLPFFRDELAAVNLSLYRHGTPWLWLLEQSEVFVATPEFEVRVAGNVLRVARQGTRVQLDATLDLEVPGDAGRVTGMVRAAGETPLRDVAPLRHPHRWSPVAPCAQVTAALQHGDRPLFSLDAPGYVDRNSGARPLDQLGVSRWEWGRAQEGGVTRVWYALEGDGAREVHGLAFSGAAVDEAAAPRVLSSKAVERGPFYTRLFAATDCGPAIAERCEVARVFARWHAPLVRMRLHRARGARSFWAPLFCGPREGRLRRLLRGGP